MDRQFGFYMLVGLGFGATFGIMLGEAIENSVLGIVLGALAGAFIGWFIAAAVRERSEGKSKEAVPKDSNTSG